MQDLRLRIDGLEGKFNVTITLPRPITGYLVQAEPMRMPAANTSAPPSTTCNAARQNGVCM